MLPMATSVVFLSHSLLRMNQKIATDKMPARAKVNKLERSKTLVTTAPLLTLIPEVIGLILQIIKSSSQSMLVSLGSYSSISTGVVKSIEEKSMEYFCV